MILLNLQFWESDKSQAMALARLIADIEPRKRNDVFLLFSARFDCAHDDETIAYCAHKFNVLKYTTKRKATGWPNGPNQMVGDSYEHIVELWRRNRIPKEINCVLFMEADCAPLHKDWISMLYREFQGCGKKILGAWLKLGDANVEHVNGNCIIAIDAWKKIPSLFHPPSKGGWDASLRRVILPNAAPSKLIWSDYQLGQAHNPWAGCDYLWEAKRYRAPDNALFGQDIRPCWFHGIKTNDGLICARERLVPKCLMNPRIKLTEFGFYVMVDDTHISRWVEKDGRLDHAHQYLSTLSHLFPEGSTVIDCGTCIGDHTITYASTVGPSGTVLGFEPNPDVAECCSLNLAPYENTKIYNVGLADDYGVAGIYVSPNVGASHLTQNGREVMLYPLDHWTKELKRCDFIKIDVEGFEPRLLDGAKETLTRFSPAILIEINEGCLKNQGFTPEDVYSRLRALGYSWEPTEHDILARKK